MEEIVNLILEYAAIWAPSLVAILGMVATIIPAILKIRDALVAFKQSDELKEIVAKLNAQSTENAELVRCNKLLLDKLTQIEGYADAKKGE